MELLMEITTDFGVLKFRNECGKLDVSFEYFGGAEVRIDTFEFTDFIKTIEALKDYR